MKYLIVQSTGCDLAILFDEILSHKDVAGTRQVVSAGFCDHLGNVFGESVTLGLNSKPEDTWIIRASMGRRI
jgi:hypothetical protein